MPHDIVIEDDEAAVHLQNLESLYTVGVAEIERTPALKHLANIEKMQRALVATLQAYAETLVRIAETNDDERFRMTGHHVMARWSREKMEAHSPGSTGRMPI